MADQTCQNMRNNRLIKTILPFFIIINLLFTAPVISQEPPAPETITELKDQLSNEMKKQHVAGLMLTLVTKDSILYAGGLGFANLEKKIPVNETQLFRVASITKLFVALGVLNLIKEGKLKTDSKLKDIAPEVPFENKWDPTNPITIAGLMEHSTGFSDKSPFEEYNFSNKQFSGLEALNVFKKFMVSKWKPGQSHSYSNVNYAILGYILEKISGKPINEYLKEKVFMPLSMPYANLILKDKGDSSDEYSKGYLWKDDHFQWVPYQPQFSAGYGSLKVSATDFAHALQVLLNDGQTPTDLFLSKDIVEDAEIPHTYLSAKRGFKDSYAYGNECVDINGHIFRGHMGATGCYLSAFLYNRKLEVGFAFSMNTHNEPFSWYVQDLIGKYMLQHIPEAIVPKPFPINEKTVAPYFGYYRWSNPNQLYSGFFDGLQNTFKLEQKGNFLQANIIGKGSLQWQAADSAGVFYKYENAVNPRIVLLKDDDDNLAITDGTMYFKKITAWQAWSSILLFAGSCLLLLSSLLFGIVQIFLVAFKKNIRTQWLLRISPFLSTIGLLLVLNIISGLFEHMKEVTPTDTAFIWWKTGLYIFALFTLFAFCTLVYQWKNIKSIWLKFYLSLTALAGCYLFSVLAINHWY
jgi:CubicO group peptidase (beta-lactamase class C family)